MDEYKIYCTESQIRKAIGLGAPINTEAFVNDSRPHTTAPSPKRHDFIVNCVIPTAEEMVGWLETQHIRVYAQPYTDECDKKFKGKINIISDITVKISKSRKIAILAAIDAALEYLEKHKNSE